MTGNTVRDHADDADSPSATEQGAGIYGRIPQRSRAKILRENVFARNRYDVLGLGDYC